MADAAVEILVENLKQLVIHHEDLIKDAKDEVERLENNLRLFKAFQKDITKQQWTEDEMLTDLIRQIRNAVYDVEDIIEAYLIHAKNKNFFHGAIKAPPKTVDIIIGEVEAAIKKVKDIYSNKSRSDFARTMVEDTRTNLYPNRQVQESDVVGFADEKEFLIRRLCEESEKLEVISIVGMPGLGKTILAEQIFRDPRIRYEFVNHIWVYVSREFTEKDIFLAILEEFTLLTDDIKSKTDQELADLVVSYLENESFLLVMDDVWSCEDWDKLQIALPRSNTMGRVLITTRFEEVALHANIWKKPHKMRFLTEKESFELLMLEAFGELNYPAQLKGVGKVISRRCDGLPLAIVLVGAILAKEVSSDITAMETAWEDVSERIGIYQAEDSFLRMERYVRLSYEKLPYPMRECFLYFGMFPEDFEIPAWKLIRLWIAEGLIQPKDSSSLEETAENYLEELIIRKLVRAQKFKLDGKAKTCRIHDLLRDFCLSEAGIRREGFLQEIKMFSDGGFQPPVSEELKFRRLCIHSHVLNFVSRKPYGSSVRSFICSSREEVNLPMKDLSAIPRGFKLLRVLDVKPIKFIDKLPRDMFQMLCLRYLVLSVNIDVLPVAFSQLWNMQTLIVATNSRTLEVRADILNMIQLNHFKTNASAALLKTSTSSTGGEKIHTLGSISPESCTEDFFDRVRNLKRLGVRGKLALLLDGKNESCGSLRKLGNLEKLKLLNDVYHATDSGIQLSGLPPPSEFPPNLKILTLSRTCLDWHHISIIGSLERLEVLKLKDKAFVGETWEVTDGGFHHLQVLLIQRTNLKTWLVEDHHFPTLRHLQLKHCDELRQVPIELADVPTFLKLDLFHSKRAAASAIKIQEKKINVKLSIFPRRNNEASSKLNRH